MGVGILTNSNPGYVYAWQLREKYGDVFTVYLGPRPIVMLCGTEALREALVDQAEAFSGRGKIAIVDPIFKGYGKGLRVTGMGQDGEWSLGRVSLGRGGKGWGGTQSLLPTSLHPVPPLPPRCDLCQRGTLEGPP